MRWLPVLLLVFPVAAAAQLPLGEAHDGVGALGTGASIPAIAGPTGAAIIQWHDAPLPERIRLEEDARLQLAYDGGSAAKRLVVMTVADPGGNVSAIGSAFIQGGGALPATESFILPVAGEIVPAGHRLGVLVRIDAPVGVVIDGAASTLEWVSVPYLEVGVAPPAGLAAGQGAQSGAASVAPVVPAQDAPGWIGFVIVVIVFLAAAAGLTVFFMKARHQSHWQAAVLGEELREVAHAPHHDAPPASTAAAISRARTDPVRRPRQDAALQAVQDELVDVEPPRALIGAKRLKLHYDPERCVGKTRKGARCSRRPLDGEATCVLHAAQLLAPVRRAPPKARPVARRGPW